VKRINGIKTRLIPSAKRPDFGIENPENVYTIHLIIPSHHQRTPSSSKASSTAALKTLQGNTDHNQRKTYKTGKAFDTAGR